MVEKDRSGERSEPLARIEDSGRERERTPMTARTTQMVQAALEYVARGYSVIPLKKDKTPFLLQWKPHQEARASEEDLARWWTAKPDALVGIVTGQISGITVVDIDARGDEAEAIRKKFPETFTTRTGNGGFHLWYKYQPGLTVSANAYPHLPRVDIRSDGGYIVAPPSVTSYKDKKGVSKGGEYSIACDCPLSSFPIGLFTNNGAIELKPRKTLSQLVSVESGARNEAMASLAGKLIASEKTLEGKMSVLAELLKVNETFKPPLPKEEVMTIFNSILGIDTTKKKKKKELDAQVRDPLVESPYQITEAEAFRTQILRKNGNGMPYKDVDNVIRVLAHHSKYKTALAFNSFTLRTEIDGEPLKDIDYIFIQKWLQSDIGLANVAKSTVIDAVDAYSRENSYNEFEEWIKKLRWDETPRLKDWVSITTGVPNDAYHSAVGAQWFTAMVRRGLEPGIVWDHVLTFYGKQGLGKTSMFRIIGGKWYKTFTGGIDEKDFYLTTLGALLVDLDEGSTLSRSDAVKIKAIITNTHDTFRAPYDRTVQTHARHFVFSMSTNNEALFKDKTGNRRFWVIKGKERVNFEWLQDNRDQLFAEAYHVIKNNIELPPMDWLSAEELQESMTETDVWEDVVFEVLKKDINYMEGNPIWSISAMEIFLKMFPQASPERIGKIEEMRIADILKKLGFERRRVRVGNERQTRWFLTIDASNRLMSAYESNKNEMPF